MSWGVTQSDFFLLQDQTVLLQHRVPGCPCVTPTDFLALRRHESGCPEAWGVPLRVCVYIQMRCARDW